MKIKYYVETNKIGSRCEDVIEIDKEEWEEMSEKDKFEMIYDALISGYMEIGWEKI